MEQYSILGRIGEGAHGIVFKAKHIEVTPNTSYGCHTVHIWKQYTMHITEIIAELVLLHCYFQLCYFFCLHSLSVPVGNAYDRMWRIFCQNWLVQPWIDGRVHLKLLFRQTGETVALKKVAMRRLEDGIPNQALREIKALQEIEDNQHVSVRGCQMLVHGMWCSTFSLVFLHISLLVRWSSWRMSFLMVQALSWFLTTCSLTFRRLSGMPRHLWRQLRSKVTC